MDISGLLRVGDAVWGRDEPLSDDEKARAKTAKEFSELVGFWVAWHSAGGFDLMEEQGWTRATIYRKIKQFREFFGEHPDDHEFDWISLDLHKVWMADLADRL